MIRVILSGAALAVLAACQPTVPDSGAGVGFEDYDTVRARRDAQLERQQVNTVPPAATVTSSNLPNEATASANAASTNSGVAPINASPSNPAPAAVTGANGISAENDFDRVSGQRSIESDAARIQQNRAQYQVIAPTALPTRSGSSGPNIVEYALQTTNSKGQKIYSRSSFNAQAKFVRSCAGYASTDQAQEAFLAMGGPEKDRKGMDPDGDGFACQWDPAPYRAVRSN